MSKGFKRILTIILTMIMVVSSVGCSNNASKDDGGAVVEDKKNDDKSEGLSEEAPETVSQEETMKNLFENQPEKYDLPLTDEPIELTIMTYIKPGAAQAYTDLSEHPVIDIFEEQTGITLNFIHPPEGDDGTFFNTIIASGDYPDIINNDFNSYPGGPVGAIEDGVIIDMTPYVAEYGYYYNELLKDMPDKIKLDSVADDGTLVKFLSIIQPPFLDGRVHVGMFGRQDLLDEYGLDVPYTINDYEKVFQVFKDNGIKVPLSLPQFNEWNWSNQSFFASAYGVTHRGFFLDDERNVKYSALEPAYKDYIAKLADWYQKGYISADFVSLNKNTAQKELQAGNAGFAIGGNWEATKINNIGQGNDPDFYSVGMPYPRLDRDDEVKYAKLLESINEKAFFVSTSCEYPVEAIKFLDYMYSQEARDLCAWGPGTEEFPTFEIDADGNRTLTEFVTNNPDGIDYAIATDRYMQNNFATMYDNEMQKEQYAPYPEKMTSWERWADGTSGDNRIPPARTHTVDESRDLAEIMTNVTTFHDESCVAFILGAKSMDEWDDFVEELKRLGVEDAIAIEQAATDRYFNR